MWILITYDIECTSKNGKKRLKKVATLCEDHGQRMQQSVFECHITPRSCKTLQQKLQRVIDDRYDNVRIYILSANPAKVINLGLPQLISTVAVV